MLAAPGLQVGSGAAIDPALLRQLRGLGFTIIRIDLQENDLAQTTQFAQQVIDEGLQPLCIIRRSEQMTALPAGALVEVGNEPDLAHFGWTVESYRRTAEACVAIARTSGQRLYVGVVSNLNTRGFAFLRRLPWDKWPSTICCSIHRYPEGRSPLIAHRPSESREEEVATLRAIVGARPLACTEIGYHDGRGGWSEAEVAEHMTWERRFFSDQGFEIISAYNINDGTGTMPIDHFGFRRLDGTWKPVALSFPKAAESQPETEPPQDLSGTVTTLLSSAGYFICAESGGGREVVVDREEASVWEQWHVHANDNGTVSLQASNGLFLCAGDDRRTVVADRTHARSWEQFEIEVRDNLIVAFKTFHGTYLQAEQGGGVGRRLVQVGDDPNLPGEWEFFASSEKFWTAPIVKTNRPLVGPLRVENKLFRDDTGLRRVFFCSWFPALRILRDNPAEFTRQLDVIAAANYQGVRIFAAVGGWCDYWDGREVAPVGFTKWLYSPQTGHLRPAGYAHYIGAWPDYDDLLRHLLRACRARGLRVHIAFGDMQIICPDLTLEVELHRRVALIVAQEGGLEVAALVADTNQYPQNRYGGDSPNSIEQMGRLTRAWQQTIPGILVGQGANMSEEPAKLYEASTHGNVCIVHPTRTPQEMALKRALGLTYWEGEYRFFPVPFWESEPAGPGKDSYQRQDDPGFLTALYAMHALCGQASNFFCGPAVRSNEPLETYWGFKELPAILAQYLPEDVATWPHTTAGGGAILYWVKGNQFATAAIKDWDTTPPRPVFQWTWVEGEVITHGWGTPPRGTGLLVGTFS